MLDKPKVNTVCDKALAVVSECKLLFTNTVCTLLETETFYDDILANLPYRLVEAEHIALFDPSLLLRLAVAEPGSPVEAAIAYGRASEGYSFITSGEPTLTAYAAVALALFYHGRLHSGESVRIASSRGELTATVTEDGVLLYD